MRSRHHRLIALTTTGALGVLYALTAFIGGTASASPSSITAVPLRLPPDAARGHNAASNLLAIDCVRPGACTAGGGYASRRSPFAPMITSQVDGRWRQATEIGLPANSSGELLSGVQSVDCAQVGDCTAVGSYTATRERTLAFVARESGGHWARAREIKPPSRASNRYASAAELTGVACTGPGTCVAIGWYSGPQGQVEPMAVSQEGGRWKQATELSLPANAVSSPAQSAAYQSVSCPRRGFCAAVGGYVNRSRINVAMAIGESGGRWGRAIEIKSPPGAAGRGSVARLSSVSCTGPGSCTAIGTYGTQGFEGLGMFASQSGGHWGRARTETALPAGAVTYDPVSLNSISCVGAEDCAATGTYSSKNGTEHIMLLHELAGKWVRASRVVLPPSLRADPKAGGEGLGVDCARSGYCAAAGAYTTKGSILRAVVLEFRTH